MAFSRIADVIGDLTGSPDPKGWSLTMLESDKLLTKGTIPTEYKSQFEGTDLGDKSGSTINNQSAVNKDAPDRTWLHGDGDVFTFTARIYQESGFTISDIANTDIFSSDSAQNKVAQDIKILKSFSKRNKDLKRAPQFTFKAGQNISFVTWVRGVRTRYDDFRRDGSLKGAVIEITLEPISESQIQTASATSTLGKAKFVGGIALATVGLVQQAGKLLNIPGGSLHTIDRLFRTRQGDTFESIAAAEYGDAILGDILRRSQPELVPLVSNTVVQLVDRQEIKRIEVTPQSIPLKDNAEVRTLKEEAFVKRGITQTIFI